MIERWTKRQTEWVTTNQEFWTLCLKLKLKLKH